jgi:small subunit ribosomal protein S8
MSSLTDPIADLLTRVRNATRVHKKEFFVPYSKIKKDIVIILKNEGYIEQYEIDTAVTHPRLKIIPRYVGKKSAVTGLQRVSRPGLRRYVSSEEIPRILGDMGISIISTSRGVITGHEARRQKLGGELLATVW